MAETTHIKLQKAIDHFLEESKHLKTGRANSSIIEQLDIEAYGSVMKLSGLANISSEGARTLLISPWDKSLMKDIESAIKNSDLSINPNVDGDIIRLNFPPLTEDVRKELLKLLGKMTEEAKIAVRNIRREMITTAEAQKKEVKMSEDDVKSEVNKIEILIKDYIQKIETISANKEKDLITI